MDLHKFCFWVKNNSFERQFLAHFSISLKAVLALVGLYARMANMEDHPWKVHESMGPFEALSQLPLFRASNLGPGVLIQISPGRHVEKVGGLFPLPFWFSLVLDKLQYSRGLGSLFLGKVGQMLLLKLGALGSCKRFDSLKLPCIKLAHWSVYCRAALLSAQTCSGSLGQGLIPTGSLEHANPVLDVGDPNSNSSAGAELTEGPWAWS